MRPEKNNYLTHCPKCTAVVRNQTECVKCGLLFEKYLLVKKRRVENARVTTIRKTRRRYRLKLTGLFCTIVMIYFLTIAPVVIFNQQIITSAASLIDRLNRPDDKETIQKIILYKPDKKFIEKARRATVLVDTATGTGSGFFITPQIIVTNKHVVEDDQERFQAFRKKVERKKKLLQFEKQQISQIKKSLKKMPKGPLRQRQQLVLEEKMEAYQEDIETQKEKEKIIADIESRLASPITKIIMADGERFQASYIEKSTRYDLALIHL